MKNIFWYIGAGAIIAVAFYFYMKKKKSGTLQPSPQNTTATPTLTSGGGTPPTPAQSPIIKRGSSGELVKTIQRAYNAARPDAIAAGVNPPPALTVDGNFGSATENAILFMYGYREIKPTDYIDTIYSAYPYPWNWLNTYIRYKPQNASANMLYLGGLTI